ncbi:MAG: hypothetical protein JXQ87_00855 [Bacteroidia bacterium]
MELQIPFYLKIFFYLLVGAGFTFLMALFKKGVINSKTDREKGAALQGKVMLFLIAWVMLLLFGSYSGFFSNFEALPPRPLLIILITLIGIILLVRNKTYQTIVSGVSPQFIIYFQAFRVPLEIWLWLLFKNEIIPVQMTFEGYNFDVVPVLLAPIVGYVVFVKKTAPIWVAKAWNYFGILTVIIIVTIAALSMPTPLRQFLNEPTNTIIVYFPYVLLPGFLVPLAILLHVTSLMQLKNNK